MKSVLPLIAVVLLASSCSTAYKSGQTPDDVYFSPEPKPVAARVNGSGNDYVQMDRENDRQYRNNRRQQYSDPNAYYDDRYLRMKVRNRRMWSDLDYYYSDPYAYRYYDPFWGNVGLWGTYNYWNPYMAWGYNYNPYYYNPYHFRPYNSHIIVGKPSSPVYSRPRTSNMNVFSRPNSPVYRGGQYQSGSRNYGNNNRTYSQPREFGNDIRRSFGTNSNNNNNTFSSPSRSTINNGSSGSSSGGSSGSSRGSSAPVRRF